MCVLYKKHAPKCQDKDNSKPMGVGILNSPGSPIDGLSEQKQTEQHQN